MDILKKNDFIVKHKSSKYFYRDIELFKKYCPSSELNRELKRVNAYNKDIYHGRILYELLEKATPEEIFNNRKGTATVIISNVTEAPPAEPQAEPESEPEAPPAEPQAEQQAPPVEKIKKKQSTTSSPV